MNKFIIIIILIITLGLAGCANMSQTEQRTVTGGAGGASVGAVIGAFAGNAAIHRATARGAIKAHRFSNNLGILALTDIEVHASLNPKLTTRVIKKGA